MFTGCKETINKGNHKGQLCGNVSVRCRHSTKTCSVCGKTFNRDTSYARHVHTCIKPVQLIKPIIKIRDTSHFEVLSQLTAEIKELKALITHQPTVNNIYHPTVNNITNTYQHIMISDVGAFNILCEKMGTNEATSFLCTLATKPKTMALFEKVYLDCEPSNYPIANNNGKDFYYRDSDNKIVHDEGGSTISKLGDRLIKNTFIEAADPMLTRFVNQNVGDHEGDDADYDKFRELQNAACAVKTDKSFIKELSVKTYYPNHQFFKAI